MLKHLHVLTIRLHSGDIIVRLTRLTNLPGLTKYEIFQFYLAAIICFVTKIHNF